MAIPQQPVGSSHRTTSPPHGSVLLNGLVGIVNRTSGAEQSHPSGESGWCISGWSVMGNKVVTFTDQQLEDYQDCTFFTRKEILRVHQRFRETSPDLVPKVMTEGQATSIQVPRERIEKLPELVENPFKTRMCEAFSQDGDGNLTFEDFLDLLSVFSEQAPRDIKVFYAFKIYGTLLGG